MLEGIQLLIMPMWQTVDCRLSNKERGRKLMDNLGIVERANHCVGGCGPGPLPSEPPLDWQIVMSYSAG